MTEQIRLEDTKIEDLEEILAYYVELDEKMFRVTQLTPADFCKSGSQYKKISAEIQKETNYKKFHYITIYKNNMPCGHIILNQLLFGISAHFHIHIWAKKDSKPALVVIATLIASDYVFKKFHLQRIYYDIPKSNEKIKNHFETYFEYPPAEIILDYPGIHDNKPCYQYTATAMDKPKITPWQEADSAENPAYLNQKKSSTAEIINEIDFLQKNNYLNLSQHVLDLNDGYNNYTAELIKRGVASTCIDVDKIGLTDSLQQYDTLLITANLGHFSDKEIVRTLEASVKMLKNSGTLIVDLPNKDFVLKNLGRHISHPISSSEFILNSFYVDENNSRLYCFRTHKKEGVKKRVFLSQKLFNADELNHFLAKFNLRIRATYGDLTGLPYDFEEAPRVVTIACCA